MSLLYSLLSHFIVPPRIACHLISVVQCACHSSTASWIKITSHKYKHSYSTRISPYRNMSKLSRARLCRIHSGSRAPSPESGSPATTGDGGGLESDKGIKIQPPLVRYLLFDGTISKKRKHIVRPERKKKFLSAEEFVNLRRSVYHYYQRKRNEEFKAANKGYHENESLENLHAFSSQNTKLNISLENTLDLDCQKHSLKKSETTLVRKIINDNGPIYSSKQRRRKSKPARVNRKVGESNSNSTTEIKQEKKVESKSLFDELFPEEILRKKESDQKKHQSMVETLPVFNWMSLIADKQISKKGKGLTKKNNLKIMATCASSFIRPKKPLSESYEDLSLLSLNACGTLLEETDFFRLGSKGQHLENWASGIIKVVPIRDETTLQFKGSYIIMFSSESAAITYRSQITRLHRLSRVKHQIESSMLPVPPGYLQDGEDIDILLRGFSLVPGYGTLTLKLLKRPYKPNISQIVNDNSLVSVLKRKTMTENLVLFYTNVGNVNMSDIQDFLKQDGKRRNLPWKLAGGYDAIIQLKQCNDSQNSIAKEVKENYRNLSSRYVLPFLGEYEARRFVREWHRRQFSLSKSFNRDDYSIPIINAELLW